MSFSRVKGQKQEMQFIILLSFTLMEELHQWPKNITDLFFIVREFNNKEDKNKLDNNVTTKLIFFLEETSILISLTSAY